MPAEPGGGAGVVAGVAPRPGPGACSATACGVFVTHIIRSRLVASAVIVVLMLSSLEFQWSFPVDKANEQVSREYFDSHFSGGCMALFRKSASASGDVMNLIRSRAAASFLVTLRTPTPKWPYSMSSAGKGPR